MIRAAFIALAMLALGPDPARAACLQQGTMVTPVYTPGTGETRISLRVSGALFYTFTTSDPTLKLLLAIHASETLRVTGDATTCPPSGIERAGGAIVNFSPLGIPSAMSILKE